MLKKIIKNRILFVIIIIAAILSLGSFGMSWKIGLAATTPTIPDVYTVNPPSFCVGSGDVNVTITGNKFINDDGTYYTEISWLGPGDTTPSIINPEYISEDGTILRFWVESSRLTQAGPVNVIVINHPELPVPFELTTFKMTISHCIFLPLLSK